MAELLYEGGMPMAHIRWDSRKEPNLTVFEALSLMIAFGALIVTIVEIQSTK